MLPIQPPFIPAYFSLQKIQQKLEKSGGQKIHKSFFLSWEDGLWQLLKVHNIPKNSKVLVPEFFCGDVVDNMRAHGLQQVTYTVDKYLQPDKFDFIKKIQTEKPEIVVIFHAVGITNPLFQNSKKWLPFLSQNSLLIEDCVHRVIDQQKIKFLTKNHYIIDSLRKVVPVQGSWIYSQQLVSKTTIKINMSTAWYRLEVFFWWIFMQFFLIAVYYLRSGTVQKLGNKFAEFAMKKGHEVIGNHSLSSCGIPGMAWLSGKLDIEKIFVLKEQQTRLYKKLLEPILKRQSNIPSRYFFAIPFPNTDDSQLRGFPLGIELASADIFLQYMRNKNVLVRFELNDSQWSKKQKIVYLPMGLYVSKQDILEVCEVVCGFFA